MTYPTKADTGALRVSDAMRRITDDEMVKMCLAVNQMFGAARRQIRMEDGTNV